MERDAPVLSGVHLVAPRGEGAERSSQSLGFALTARGPSGARGDLEQPVRDGPSSFGWLATGTAGPVGPRCPVHGRVQPPGLARLWHLVGLAGPFGPVALRLRLPPLGSLLHGKAQEEGKIADQPFSSGSWKEAELESQVRGQLPLAERECGLENRKTKRTRERERASRVVG